MKNKIIFVSLILLLGSCGIEPLPDLVISKQPSSSTKSDSSNQQGNTNNQPDDISGDHSIVPRITEVLVNGNSWKQPAWRFEVGTGVQLKALPFTKIDQIVLGINIMPNQISKESFSLKGKLTGVIEIQSVDSDPFSNQIKLNFKEPLVNDWYLLTAHEHLITYEQKKLDGEWSNPSSFESKDGRLFPSGDGNEGGDFRFLFGVLVGNVVAFDEFNNREVSQTDVSELNSHTLDEKPYDRWYDINSDGIVNSSDNSTTAMSVGNLPEVSNPDFW